MMLVGSDYDDVDLSNNLSRMQANRVERDVKCWFDTRTKGQGDDIYIKAQTGGG